MNLTITIKTLHNPTQFRNQRQIPPFFQFKVNKKSFFFQRSSFYQNNSSESLLEKHSMSFCSLMISNNLLRACFFVFPRAFKFLLFLFHLLKMNLR